MSDRKVPRRRQNGEPVTPAEVQIQGVTCCDCGLTHLVVYEVDDSNFVTVAHYADPYLTQKVREHMGVKVVSTKKGAKK